MASRIQPEPMLFIAGIKNSEFNTIKSGLAGFFLLIKLGLILCFKGFVLKDNTYFCT